MHTTIAKMQGSAKRTVWTTFTSWLLVVLNYTWG